MRKGELENLEWADVDFKRRKIMSRRKPFWQPKTGEREIPIGSQLFPILRRLGATNTKGLKSNFVFPHKDGTQIKVKLREQLIKVARSASIPDLPNQLPPKTRLLQVAPLCLANTCPPRSGATSAHGTSQPKVTYLKQL